MDRMEELEDIRDARTISAAISAPALSQIENGKRAPSVDLLVKLSKALRCEMENLIRVDDEGPRTNGA